jgi:hypothetical protein
MAAPERPPERPLPSPPRATEVAREADHILEL